MGWSSFYSVPKGESADFPDIVFKLGKEGGDEEVRITGVWLYDLWWKWVYEPADEDIQTWDDFVALRGGFLRGIRSFFAFKGGRVGCKFSVSLI